MGHKQKKCLKTQAMERFNEMRAYGQSKADVKRAAEHEYKTIKNPTCTKQEYINNALRNKIYSYKTYDTYAKQNNYFLDWCTEKGLKTLDECRPYVDEWLTLSIEKGNSPYTIATQKAGLAKLYQESSTNFRETPERKRSGITRSRGPAIRDTGYSLKNNADYIDFVRATGCRASEAARCQSDDLWQDVKTGQFYLTIKGKGGRIRNAPIIGEKAERIADMIQRADGRVWDKIPSHADTHSYRSEYATAIYRAYERDLGTIDRKDKYFCRSDLKGRVLDREAMLKASEALGHNRISVVADHYIR